MDQSNMLFVTIALFFSDKTGSQRMMAFSVPELMTYMSYSMVRYKCNMGTCCGNFSLVLT